MNVNLHPIPEEIQAWRNKRRNRRCVFCQYCTLHWVQNKCIAKQKDMGSTKIRRHRPFCQLYLGKKYE